MPFNPFIESDRPTMENFNEKFYELYDDFSAALNNKAPAGYGLGADAALSSDFNQAVLSGWYACSGSSNGPTESFYGWLLVSSRNGASGMIRQDAWSSVSQPVHYVRYAVDGVWTPWEYIDPPMSLGVEYRTTERFNGKPVYVMAVDGGAFPDNSSKTIEVQIPDASGQIKMLDCYGVLDNGTQIPGLFGSAVFAASDYLGLFTQNGPGKFTISVGSGRTVGLNFTLFLKYRKE